MFQVLVESMPKLTVCVNPVGGSFGLIPFISIESERHKRGIHSAASSLASVATFNFFFANRRDPASFDEGIEIMLGNHAQSAD